MAIVLFDGVCNLCNGAVQFIIQYDTQNYFQFTALQSAKGQQLLRHYQLPTHDFGSFILIEEGKVYMRSTAALRVAKHLRGWRWAYYGLAWLPLPLRDWGYDWIAKNRYHWFGKRAECMMPTPELQKKFL